MKRVRREARVRRDRAHLEGGAARRPQGASAAQIRVGVSACLLGERVRYDGGHKRARVVADLLASRFELVPVCPEVELGMGVPREPVRLVRARGGVRMRGVETGRDHTRAMGAFARRRARALAAAGLSGFVWKSRSPSCGLAGIPVQAGEGVARSRVAGLFAAEVRRRLPRLPVAEEVALGDARFRARFVARVLAYHRRIECPKT